MRVLTFSRTFPAYHPKAGQPTYFVEKFLNSMHTIGHDYSMEGYPTDFIKDLQLNHLLQKYHTIRAGNRWKAGDKFSPRVWSGKPYNSKQIIIAPDVEIKKVWNVEVEIVKEVTASKREIPILTKFIIDGKHVTKNYYMLADNDGLTLQDLFDWFPKPFKGQIICWNEKIDY